MPEPILPLDDNELLQLDTLLRQRFDDDDDGDDDIDPGVFDISELDGMLTALASGPNLPPQTTWIQAVWGDLEPDWDSEQEFDVVNALLLRHLNTVAATLAEVLDEFEPLFLYEEEDGETWTIVDHWCEGYLRGIQLEQKSWDKGKPGVTPLLAPIRAFSSVSDWQGHELDVAEQDRLSDAIVPNVRALYAFWHTSRGSEQPAKPRNSPRKAPRDSPWKRKQ